MNRKILSKVLMHLFSFVSALALFALVMCLISVLFFNSSFQKNLPKKIGYYDLLYSELVSDLKKLSASSGVSEQFFETAVDKSQMTAHAKAYLDAAFDAADRASLENEQSEYIKTDLYEKLCVYAQDEGYMLTESISEELLHLTEICAQKYTDRTAPASLSIVYEYLGKASNKLMIPLIIVTVFLIAFAAFCIYFARRLNASLSILLCSGGLALALPPAAVYISGVISRISIGSKSMHTLVSALINSILLPMLFTGILVIISSIAIFIIKNFKKGKDV